MTVPAGVTDFTVTFPTTGDTLDESDETTNLQWAVSPRRARSLDNDTVSVSTVTNATTTEGGNLVHTVTLSTASDATRTFAFTLTDGTATSGDYGAATFSNGVTLSAWPDHGSCRRHDLYGHRAYDRDTIDESDETTNLSVGGVAATGTITDNDAPPTISINDVTVDREAAGSATFTVTLSAASSLGITVVYGSANNSATAGSDYTAAAGTLTFAAGVTTQVITVPITNDLATQSSETFNINLSGAVNATIADSQGVGTITDNDQPPAIDLDGNDSSGAVGNDYTTTFTENGPAVAIGDVDIVITDVDSTVITGATITLTNLQANDLLAAGVLPGGIVASAYDTFTGVMTLSGNSSLANYQAAIAAIAFSNSSENPSTTPRTITVTVTDGNTTSAAAVATVNVTPNNDPPTTSNTSGNGNEDPASPIPIVLTGLDIDGTVDTFTLTTLPANGALYLDAARTLLVGLNTPLTAAGNALTLYFQPLLDWHGSTTFDFVATDNNGASSASAIGTINVASVDDGPPVANADTYNVVASTPYIISIASLLGNGRAAGCGCLPLIHGARGWRHIDQQR